MAGEAPADFSAQASSAGLVLPQKRRTNPWVAAGIILVIIVAALGIGAGTGWLNPPSSPAPFSHPAGCATPVVELYGSVPNDAGPETMMALQNLSTGYLATSGGCIGATLNLSSPAAPLAALEERQVQYAVVDDLPTTASLNSSPPGSLVFPQLIGSVRIVYNLPSFTAPLHLNAAALAAIYLGTAPNWSAPAITALNPSITDATNLTVVYESTPGVATSVFTAFLSQANSSWARAVGSASNVSWPTGIDLLDSGDVVDYVSTHPGAIGFASQTTEIPEGVGVAEIENAAGQFASPNETGMQNAATALLNSSPPADQEAWNASIADYAGNWSYPLTTFSYLVVTSDLAHAYGAAITPYSAWWLLTFLDWAMHAGQAIPQSFGFAASPDLLTTLSTQILADVQYNGTSVLAGGSEGGETGGETGEF